MEVVRRPRILPQRHFADTRVKDLDSESLDDPGKIHLREQAEHKLAMQATFVARCTGGGGRGRAAK